MGQKSAKRKGREANEREREKGEAGSCTTFIINK